MSKDLVDDLGPDGADDLDPRLSPTAALLRDVLAREGDRVQPAPDGLARIRAAIAEDSPAPGVRGLAGFRRGRPAPARRSWVTALAAAASVVVLAGAGVAVAQNLPVLHKGTAANVHPKASAPGQLPVYEVGTVTRNGRVLYRLFREYYSTTNTTTDARLTEALSSAVTRRPQDPDYIRVFGGGGGSAPLKATWDAKAQVVDVELTPAMTTVRLATDDRAFIAIQQIVFTATAVLNKPDVAVRISVRAPAVDTYMFGRTSYPLGGKFYRAHGTDDPTAPVLLVDPQEGITLGRKAQDIQVSVGYEARSGVAWKLTRNGAEVGSGVVQPGFQGGVDKARPGNRGIATIPVDHTLPGDYELVVSQLPSVAEPPWTDSRTFVVN